MYTKLPPPPVLTGSEEGNGEEMEESGGTESLPGDTLAQNSTSFPFLLLYSQSISQKETHQPTTLLSPPSTLCTECLPRDTLAHQSPFLFSSALFPCIFSHSASVEQE